MKALMVVKWDSESIHSAVSITDLQLKKMGVLEGRQIPLYNYLLAAKSCGKGIGRSYLATCQIGGKKILRATIEVITAAT